VAFAGWCLGLVGVLCVGCDAPRTEANVPATAESKGIVGQRTWTPGPKAAETMNGEIRDQPPPTGGKPPGPAATPGAPPGGPPPWLKALMQKQEEKPIRTKEFHMPPVPAWFEDARFGVYIHWTLRSLDIVPGGYRHWKEQATVHFTASKYDAKEWAALFKRWGAKYAVLTTKHHLGFALYDCAGNDWTAVKSTPAKRDLVAEYVQAMREAGLKVGLYFSLPDYNHPDYTRNKHNINKFKKEYSIKDDPPRWERFVTQMHREVEHLCTAYGKIDLLYFDGDWEQTAQDWRSVELVRMILRHQPGIVLNNRLRHADLGHYSTPESIYPGPEFYLRPRPWELASETGDGFHCAAGYKNIRPVSELVRLFGDVISMGGNHLLNVAPLADGSIPADQVAAMDGLGTWIAAHSEAVHGTRAGLPPGYFNGGSTTRDNILYLFVYDPPIGELVVKGLPHMPKRITHLTTGKELAWRISGRKGGRYGGWVFVGLPKELVEEHATVLRMEFDKGVSFHMLEEQYRHRMRGAEDEPARRDEGEGEPPP
jgi:alpha-L-fucosidase